jgi:hypothetical protein
MRTSETLSELTKSMINLQKELPTIGRDKKGYNYFYVTLDNIIETTKPLLCKNNLLVIQSISEKENGVSIVTRLQHATGEFIEDSFSLPKTELQKGNNVQMLGASITYGKRYALGALFNIATEEDTDGTEKKPIENFTQIDKDIQKEISRLGGYPDTMKGWESFTMERKIQALNWLKNQKKEV